MLKILKNCQIVDLLKVISLLNYKKNAYLSESVTGPFLENIF